MNDAQQLPSGWRGNPVIWLCLAACLVVGGIWALEYILDRREAVVPQAAVQVRYERLDPLTGEFVKFSSSDAEVIERLRSAIRADVDEQGFDEPKMSTSVAGHHELVFRDRDNNNIFACSVVNDATLRINHRTCASTNTMAALEDMMQSDFKQVSPVENAPEVVPPKSPAKTENDVDELD